MNTIRETQEKAIQQSASSLLDDCINKTKVEKLPTALLDHDFGPNVQVSTWVWTDRIDVDFHLGWGYRTQADVDSLKKELGKFCGVAFTKVVHQYNEYFNYEGELIDGAPDGCKVRVTIQNAPKPEKCILTKSFETRTVEVYKATCSDTNEEM
jgi:hypothetical protein